MKNVMRQSLIALGYVKPSSARTDRGIDKLHGKASQAAAIAARQAEQGKTHSLNGIKGFGVRNLVSSSKHPPHPASHEAY